jgi:multimeric flavodoxin WrbA
MASLNDKQLEMCSTSQWDFSDLNALFINCTLKRSPEPSHTRGLIDISKAILEKNGVSVDVVRAVDYDIAYGVWPDMTDHGWEHDAWPGILKKVMDAEILILTSSIWLGEKTSVCTKVIERLYAV